MDPQSLNWSFGDPDGWAIACGLFLLFAAAVGWLVYRLSCHFLGAGSIDQVQRVSRRPGAILGTLAALVIFGALYYTSLGGFARLEYRNGQLTIHYMLPARNVVLPFIVVTNVQERQAFKNRARLVLITDTNGTYESALATQSEVRRAGEWARRQMRQPHSLVQ